MTTRSIYAPSRKQAPLSETVPTQRVQDKGDQHRPETDQRRRTTVTVLIAISCLAAGYIAGMIHAAIITKGGQG